MNETKDHRSVIGFVVCVLIYLFTGFLFLIIPLSRLKGAWGWIKKGWV